MTRIFGTDGVRGIANSELTPELAFQLGKAGALVLTEGTHKPKILVAKDTRISGDLLENALVAGILSVGAEAVLLGVVPTPAVAYLIRKDNADAGVMISASHNPVEFNGIKFFNKDGFKLSDQLEDDIQAMIENNFEGAPVVIGADIGHVSRDEKATDDYVDFAVSTLEGDLSGMKIAIDCANGASYIAAEKAFKALGAETILIHHTPNGININEKCGSTHPQDLMDVVKREKCDLGLAFDGDADRCLAVDEKGNLVNGDFIILISGLYLKEIGKLRDNTIVVTVMSNLGLMLAAKELGINVEITSVGDRYVLENIMDNNYSLGGEQSGHVIFKDFNTTGDGMVTGIQLAGMVKAKKKPLSELASVMRELPQILVNVQIPNEFKNIHNTDEDVKNLILKVEEKLHGVGRVLIRPSGTEPLVRIMLEGENQEEINEAAHAIRDLIMTKIS